jgi:hypothetical protein
MDEDDMWHVWETEELLTWIWWEDLMERKHLVELVVDSDYIKIGLQEVGLRSID